jgi:hypothetical protein
MARLNGLESTGKYDDIQERVAVYRGPLGEGARPGEPRKNPCMVRGPVSTKVTATLAEQGLGERESKMFHACRRRQIGQQWRAQHATLCSCMRWLQADRSAMRELIRAETTSQSGRYARRAGNTPETGSISSRPVCRPRVTAGGQEATAASQRMTSGDTTGHAAAE